ncbi:hypothetical protein [Nocardioides campestrisoli]|uniref:hypothetical protein n=1 Tax=Nocardioides campestrisoli TaxID=2736757 RepID=UPI00163D7306|nr:hypothetical protein [Nocardioides campestrisoli]
MATSTAPAVPTGTDPFRDAVDAIVGSDVLVDLDRVARILNMPGRNAVRHRMRRGTLPLRLVQPGGETAATLVPAADLYAVLGLMWTSPAPGTKVLATVLPDGSVAIETASA